ncbi:glycosyltransferase (plasmid) [Rhizobium sp. CB3171]|uniref:glycosyltransferase family 2 protein n=1 Tax=Rhizobium sp. CB3171 TaxID=3039157 RepID=UPI0024B24DA9|nr:glycosyltransferase [Rhizobium sp. CB3171]WFU07154.1 glycosyltransferase [Rhizobium sp. CB3171]
MATLPNTVVCIATFRRPLGLSRCLDALAEADLQGVARVIVADNDAAGQAGLEACEKYRAAGQPFSLTAITVAKRGISQVRNALIAEALKDPRVEFIAMIDDDEWPLSGWIQSLLAAQQQTGADIVGGPVERVFAVPVPAYLKNANLADFSQMRTGSIDFVDGTCNVLIRADLFRRREAPWFDPAFDLLGGEDTDLFLALKLQGAQFAWSSEAIVKEEMPESRSSARWMLERAYRIGNTYSLVNRKHRPPGFGALRETLKIAATTAFVVTNLAVFFWHPTRRFEAARLGARVLGKMAGLLDYGHAEYRTVHGR